MGNIPCLDLRPKMCNPEPLTTLKLDLASEIKVARKINRDFSEEIAEEIDSYLTCEPLTHSPITKEDQIQLQELAEKVVNLGKKKPRDLKSIKEIRDEIISCEDLFYRLTEPYVHDAN